MLVGMLAGLLLCGAACAEEIRVSLAISLKEAVTEITQAYEKDSGEKVTLTFGASGQLATQIKNGAEVDVFISAADKPVDDLDKAGLVAAGTRRVVAGNALVVVVPPGSTLALTSLKGLADQAVTRVAIGNPRTVPAGEYALEAFKAVGIDAAIRERLFYGTNVRQVLTYVEAGEVSAGVVYATEARESGAKVKVALEVDGKLHGPVLYPAVVLKSSKKQAAGMKFLDYLKGDQARAALQKKGFSMAADPATMPAK